MLPIDQQCEKYIKENKLEKTINEKIDLIYKRKELKDLNTKENYLKEMMA